MGASIAETVDARKERRRDRLALAVLEGIDHLYVTRGRKVVHLDLRHESPDGAELLRLLLGPSGHLRAPVVRRGRTLVVGFDADLYRRLLAGRTT